MKNKKPKIIVILGPTAVGKTKIATKLAARFNGEIVSADSRQVYRGMDIGTGKDMADYEVLKNGKKIKIPYHLIDIVSPKTKFSLARYQKMAYQAIDNIISRGKVPFLTGGTGLYIDAVVNGLLLLPAKENKNLREKMEKWSNARIFKKLLKIDPELAQIIDKGNKRRMIRYIEIMTECKRNITQLWKEQKMISKYDALMLGIIPKTKKTQNIASPELKDIINRRIDQRVESRLKEGMIKEVETLHNENISWKRLESFGLEYKYISYYLKGELEYDKMVSLLKIAIHQFAKRQITWFKKNKKIIWVSEFKKAQKNVEDFFN